MSAPDHLFAFDLETTGLSFTNDRIVSAAVVGEFLPNGGRKIIMNPGMPIPEESTRVHGITDAMVAQEMSYVDGLSLLNRMLVWAWNAGGVMVGHNIHGYDLPMLRMQERQVFGREITSFGPSVDTLGASRRAMPGEIVKLTNVCERLGIALHNAHDAASDAWASLAVARALNVVPAGISA